VPGGAGQVQTYPAETAMLVSGGPEATAQLAGQGILDTGQAVILASDLADVGPGPEPAVDSTDVVASMYAPGAPGAPAASTIVGPATPWVATDTLDRRDHQFGLVHGSASYLLGATEMVAGSADAPRQWADRPLGSHQTVAAYVDGMSVTASSYGSELLQAPEEAPFNAVDGLTDTAWQARRRPGGGLAGQWIMLDVGRQVEVGKITVRLLAETLHRPAARALRVTTQAGYAVTPVAPNEDEQSIAVPAGPTRWFRVAFEEVARERSAVLGAGIREITIPGVRFLRYAQMPSDLAPVFTRPGSGPLIYSFDRDRVDPSTPFGGDEERAIARRFEVPRTASFRMAGAAMYLLPDDGSKIPPGAAPLDTGCGGGPSIKIDGAEYKTRITGSWGDVPARRPMPLTVCTPDGNGVVTLGSGRHLLTVEQHNIYQTIDSLSMVDVTMGAHKAGPRSTRITSWSPERRTVEIGAGERAFLTVKENANPSWTARLGGQELSPVRLDGWQQGWVVPAGEGGTITIENAPGASYRRNLLVGLLLVGLLLLMVVIPDRLRLRPKSDPDGIPRWLVAPAAAFTAPIGRLPAWSGPAVLATAALALVAGPVALAVPILVAVGLRRPAVLPGLAFAAAAAAGIGVAVDPGRLPDSGEGAFSVHVQAAGAVGLAAVLASLALPATPARGRHGRRDREERHDREDRLGGEDRDGVVGVGGRVVAQRRAEPSAAPARAGVAQDDPGPRRRSAASASPAASAASARRPPAEWADDYGITVVTPLDGGRRWERPGPAVVVPTRYTPESQRRTPESQRQRDRGSSTPPVDHILETLDDTSIVVDRAASSRPRRAVPRWADDVPQRGDDAVSRWADDTAMADRAAARRSGSHRKLRDGRGGERGDGTYGPPDEPRIGDGIGETVSRRVPDDPRRRTNDHRRS
jgi:arabinofuranan 3-O-arabinosyltransferase